MSLSGFEDLEANHPQAFARSDSRVGTIVCGKAVDVGLLKPYHMFSRFVESAFFGKLSVNTSRDQTRQLSSSCTSQFIIARTRETGKVKANFWRAANRC
jgi:hypothetical protein